VKVTAYDYSIYGGLSGTLEHISPNAARRASQCGQSGISDVYYKVIVRTNSATLKRRRQGIRHHPRHDDQHTDQDGKKTILDIC